MNLADFTRRFADRACTYVHPADVRGMRPFLVGVAEEEFEDGEDRTPEDAADDYMMALADRPLFEPGGTA